MSEENKDNHGESGSSSHGSHKHGGGGHGGSHEEGHEGAPEWLISFADNVALMMGFFVILLAMNMAKQTTGGIGGEGKYPSDTPAMEDFALAIRSAFNNPVDINSTDPHDAALRRRLREREKQGEAHDPGPEGNNHDVQAVRPTDFTNTAGFVTFAEGADTLTDQGRKTISEVASRLRGMSWIIEVRGHASAAESRRDKDKAMRLAFQRALATAQALVTDGLRWEQLRVVACADNERATPLASDTDGHSNNQRAEIVVTQEQMPPDPFNRDATGPPGL